ncbi:MAG: hypothetical protein PVJ53_12715 [Desulfobacterales bacterium]|jgi:hypothetical protein
MKRLLKLALVIMTLGITVMVIFYFYQPVKRIGVTSELIMLGDLDGDNQWRDADLELLNKVLENPYAYDRLTLLKIDINQNGLLDVEDLTFLERIYGNPDPYAAAEIAAAEGAVFPRPRELYRYLPRYEYVERPLILLDNDIGQRSPLPFLEALSPDQGAPPYLKQLFIEIYHEALRFSFGYAVRQNQLDAIEQEYVANKIDYCNDLFERQQYYELLLNLIGLVEDAETLTIKTQSEFIQRLLYFRDHLRELLLSEEFDAFSKGQLARDVIFNLIEDYLESDLNLTIDLASLSPPRDFSDWKNYLDRAEWQVYKSKTRRDDFRQLVLYAQHDRRYLRAVSETSPSYRDITLQNHNLPMILLFREALRIANNDKKQAVGLLDEAVRIPLAWVKSIPKSVLPSSVALENFLLPGNKEDGSDKSRHWNVFGGVAIYKSPEESLTLALKREIMDLREENDSPEAMREFIRDTIANINGIYYVVSIDPDLLARAEGR